MKRLMYLLCVGILLIVSIQGCKESDLGTIVNDGTLPGPITNATVENLNGAAKITYMVPQDKDLLYIRAEYTTKKGVIRETKVSYYSNNLTVVGFGDTDKYEVRLYAVDRGGNQSQAVSVTVQPKPAPFLLVREGLTVAPDFGGISVNFSNPTEDNITLVVLTNNALGEFLQTNVSTTDVKSGIFTIRGFDAVERKFGVFVRDRWGNVSDTLITTIKPLFEVKLDRTKMKAYVLPTDAPLGYNGQISYLFNNDFGNDGYHSGDAARMPQWFTYDMGVTAKLSRLSWFMRPGFYYNLHSPKKIEIWGSNNPPADGSFNNWTLLVEHEQVKPSGLPVGQLSNADNEAGAAGENVNFPINLPKFRYIRFKTLSNWTNGTYVNFHEIMMWGAPD